jgi:hypothetical protein
MRNLLGLNLGTPRKRAYFEPSCLKVQGEVEPSRWCAIPDDKFGACLPEIHKVAAAIVFERALRPGDFDFRIARNVIQQIAADRD